MRLISAPASGADTRTGWWPVLSVFVFAYPPTCLHAGFTAAYNLSVTRTAPAAQPPGGEGDTAPLFGGVGELGVATNIATLPVGEVSGAAASRWGASSPWQSGPVWVATTS